MKRFLLSIGISFVLIVGYLVVGTAIVVISSNDPNKLDPQAIAMVDVPFRLPKYVYYYFFPPTLEDFSTDPSDLGFKKAIISVVFFGINLLIYSLPVYVLLSLISRLRRRSAGLRVNAGPPGPPTFTA